eukprot:m51a1_g9019 hypothetical protein (777) ;mRNA; f:177825-180620
MVVLVVLALLALSSASRITYKDSDYTFQFTQSISGLTLWTAPATRRVRSTDGVPTATGSALDISCAKGELESFQIVIAPTSAFSSIGVSVGAFGSLGPTAWTDVGVASWVAPSPWATSGGYKVGESTTKVTNVSTVPLSASSPTLLWITQYVPVQGTKAGATSANVVITPNGAAPVTIGVNLYVFNFELDATPHYDTFLMSQPGIKISTLEQLDAQKEVYLRHRMSSPGPGWPNGLNYQVAWDCKTESLIDTDPSTSKQQCVWANGCTVQRYVMGKGSTWRGVNYDDWIGQGFSSAAAVSTDNNRPDPFCGVSCSASSAYKGWVCQKSYEEKWGKYLAALQSYTARTGMAYLCSVRNKYAPNLRIMVSREAQPWIAERPDFGYCSYDIWLPWVWRYTTTYTWMRQECFDEVSWFYSLDTDNSCGKPGQCNTALAPVVSKSGSNSKEDPVAASDGPHYRLIPWVSWANRITGWGYYHSDIFWDTPTGQLVPRPHISASLLREGFEDYEYLWLANSKKRPSPHSNVPVDQAVLGLGFAVGVWRNDPTAIHALRHQLGRMIEGSRADMPWIATSPARPFGNYYIDFANTTANPTHATFTYQGRTWIPIGWDAYDVELGFGWNSPMLGVPNTIQTGNPVLRCYNVSDGNLVEKSICYNDYNHPDFFHFQVAPGVYNMTVGVGWPGRCRSDTEFVSINNVVLRNSSEKACNVRAYSQLVTVRQSANGGQLVMTLGNDRGYTILSYLTIEGVSQTVPSLACPKVNLPISKLPDPSACSQRIP